MLNVVLSNQMKRDLKLAQKRGCNISLLKLVVNKLANQEFWQKNIKTTHCLATMPTSENVISSQIGYWFTE